MTGEIHWDVASYALGVLDERETLRFEEHLAGCAQCGPELDSLLPVVDLLAEVNGRDLAIAERSEADGAMFERVLAAVGQDRRRARSRRMYSLAAGVVLLAMLTGLALFVGTRVAGPGPTTAQPPGLGSSDPTPGGPRTSGRPGPGIGGPDLPAGERFNATDRTSGVRAEVILGSTPFGTRVSFALSRLSGPRVCRLVLLRETGPAEVISSWKVPPAGYGTLAQPDALLLQAATAIPRAEIDRLQVQVIDDSGVASALVTVPV